MSTIAAIWTFIRSLSASWSLGPEMLRLGMLQAGSIGGPKALVQSAYRASQASDCVHGQWYSDKKDDHETVAKFAQI